MRSVLVGWIELRLAHLRAHLQTRAAMSEAPVASYDRLRGAGGGR